MLFTCLIIYIIYQSVTLRRDTTIIMSRSSVNIILYCIIICYINFNMHLFEKSIGLFGSLFNTSTTIHSFHMFILILSFVILGLTSFYPRKIITNNSYLKKSNNFTELSNEYKSNIINKTGDQFRIIEYSLILLFIIIGSLFLISSSDLVSIFLSIELQSYGLYLISTIYRDSEPATAGGLTYFLLGGLSSCFILLSTSLLYVNSGSTNLDNLYVVTTITNINNNLEIGIEPYYINISLIVIGVGLLFKVSAAPFHFWSPDVYDSIPTIVTTFVAIIAKISIFILLLELIYFTNKSQSGFSWTIILLISSLLSLIVGTVLGLTQSRIKRLYAYSTISHVGFILLALSIQTVESVQACIFYLIQYSVSNLNAFILLLSIGFSLYCYTNNNKEYKSLKDKSNSPIQLISQLKGYFHINPVLALSLAITLFSFIGIPPLIGFFGKQLILKSALDSGYIFMCLVAILTSVISAVYYLLIIKQMFFDKNQSNVISSLHNYEFSNIISSSKPLVSVQYFNDTRFGLKLKYNNIVISNYFSISISILTLIILIFMFTNTFLFNMSNLLALTIFYN